MRTISNIFEITTGMLLCVTKKHDDADSIVVIFDWYPSYNYCGFDITQIGYSSSEILCKIESEHIFICLSPPVITAGPSRGYCFIIDGQRKLKLDYHDLEFLNIQIIGNLPENSNGPA